MFSCDAMARKRTTLTSICSGIARKKGFSFEGFVGSEIYNWVILMKLFLDRS